MKRLLWGIIALVVVGCSEPDTYRYELNAVELQSAQADKTREKSIEQYISILYANLFQKALSADEMAELRKVIESVGDKELVFEVIIANLMNRPDVILPSNESMRADIDGFLTETYRRFYIRVPTEAEKAYLRNLIQSDPNFSVEMVYTAFALSEEYRFY